MRTSTIAAFTAAAFLGFGAVGSAMAETELSGFGDINYDGFSSSGEEGHFRAAGEVDIIQKGDGPTFRADLDILDALNSSPQVDVPTGTGGVGVDVEQVNGTIPVNDMATIVAGVFNSFHGLEGQDATDYNFAANGLLWQYVASNVAGAMVEVTPTDMVSVKVGYINHWLDLVAADPANDVIAGVSVTPIEGLGINVSYLTDETETVGDELDINATISMVENLVVSLEYLMADPATGTGASAISGTGTFTSSGFDNGYGLHAAYMVGDITVAGRYEAASYEGTGKDVTWGSASVGYNLAEGTVVRLDYSNMTVDSGGSEDTVTAQIVHSYDGMM